MSLIRVRQIQKKIVALALSVGVLFSASSLRAEAGDEPVRLDLRLMASDLVDELVYQWLKDAPFQGPTNLIVAEVNAPVGIDQRFSEDIENHLFEVLRANPKLSVQLVHCGLCRQWVTVSNPKRTVIGRALDQPEAQQVLRQYDQLHALSLHFDVLADDLVLWAEIYEVAPPQKISWTMRLSHSRTARTLLREPSKLVSISEARREQRELLQGYQRVEFATRFPIRTFAAAATFGNQVEIPPLIFIEQSFEAALAPKKNRRAGLTAGFTSLKDSMQGWSVGASFSQLLGRPEPSLTEPDLYLRLAVNYLRLEGPNAAIFAQNQIDIPKMMSADEEPKASLTTYQIGLEAHVKYRFGLSVFFEYIPLLDSNSLVAKRNFIIPYHSVGVAGVFLW